MHFISQFVTAEKAPVKLELFLKLPNKVRCEITYVWHSLDIKVSSTKTLQVIDHWIHNKSMDILFLASSKLYCTPASTLALNQRWFLVVRMLLNRTPVVCCMLLTWFTQHFTKFTLWLQVWIYLLRNLANWNIKMSLLRARQPLHLCMAIFKDALNLVYLCSAAQHLLPQGALR